MLAQFYDSDCSPNVREAVLYGRIGRITPAIRQLFPPFDKPVRRQLYVELSRFTCSSTPRFPGVSNRLILPISILGLVSREERFVALLKLEELFDEESMPADICA